MLGDKCYGKNKQLVQVLLGGGGGSCSIKQVVSHMEDLSTGAEGEAVRQSNIWRTSCKKKDGPEQPPKAVCASFVGRTPRRPFGR